MSHYCKMYLITIQKHLIILMRKHFVVPGALNYKTTDHYCNERHGFYYY